MKYLIYLFLLLPAGIAFSQDAQVDDIKKFQKELNEEFRNPEESPLTKKQRRKFKGHHFFPINKKYIVKAVFKRWEDTESFQMKTTTDRLSTYDKYGMVTFSLDGKEYQLTVYQSHRLRETDEYKNYLFLPFADFTNGEETYGGGRYIDLSIPSGNEIIIDFNQAYSPSCAYNHSYSCPIPPEENHLKLRIEAGVKNLGLKDH